MAPQSLLGVAQRGIVRLRTDAASPYLIGGISTKVAMRFPFLQPLPQPTHTDQCKRCCGAPLSRASPSMLRSKSTASVGARSGDQRAPYGSEHQQVCPLCQTQAINHFTALDSALRQREKRGREELNAAESAARRELFKVYAPMHRRILSYTSEILAQQRSQMSLAQVQAAMTQTETDELTTRRQQGSEMLRTLRALYRCAQRERGIVAADLERAAADERVRLEIAELAAAQQRQAEAVRQDKLLRAKLAQLHNTEERRRFELSGEEFRAWVQLALRHRDGHAAATEATSKRGDLARTQERTRLCNDQQGAAREAIDGDERMARAEIRNAFFEELAIVRSRVLRNRLADWESREATLRRAKGSALFSELLTVQLSALEKHESYLRAHWYSALEAEAAEALVKLVSDERRSLSAQVHVAVADESPLGAQLASEDEVGSPRLLALSSAVFQPDDELLATDNSASELQRRRSEFAAELVDEIVEAAVKVDAAGPALQHTPSLSIM